jgi:tetratricopeptide (TPR) repeat protein
MEEAEFYRQQGLLDEAEAIYQRVLKAAPSHPLALVRLGEIVAARGEDPGRSASGAAAPEPAQAGESDPDIGSDLADWSDDDLSDGDRGAEAAPAPRARGRAAGDDTAEELGLADSGPSVSFDEDHAAISDVEIDVDLGDDAEAPADDSDSGEITGVDVLAPVEDDGAEEPRPAAAAARKGERPTAVDRPALATDDDSSDGDADAAESDDDVSAPPGEEPLAAQAGADGGEFDLASVLSDAFEPGDRASASGRGADDGFEAVFSAFKQGVKRTLGEGDTEAHYDLGIAYREMGLLEDAMGEFQLASASPARRIESLQMLGMCALDLGRGKQAREQLEAALRERGITEVQALAARFELGRACEALGDLAAARAAWEAVAAEDPGFCEVEERLASLGRAKRGAAPPADKSFESFGDLFDNLDGAETEEAEEAAPEHEAFEDLIAEAGEELDDDEDEVPPPPRPKSSGPKRPAPEPAPRRKKKISFV